MTNFAHLVMKSWLQNDCGIHDTASLLSWIQDINCNTKINIEPTEMNDNGFWFYDDNNGKIQNRKQSFFSIMGIRQTHNGTKILETPIIQQTEIGFLGIICKIINHNLYFLMQAKIEPGNINGVQISPTIQATKSNFTCAHGGKAPLYLEWFQDTNKQVEIIYDQIQSEQGSRFVGKRNRNIIILIHQEIDVYDNFRWMSLGQIKELLKHDNLVNMDTRTVLSGLLTMLDNDSDKHLYQYFEDKTFYNSIFSPANIIPALTKLNNFKMFSDTKEELVPLNHLSDWKQNRGKITCLKPSAFHVDYFDIEIEGREIQKWQQPLFCAEHRALFVLITRINNNIREFLIRLCPEIGCFDKVEFGPSIMLSNEEQLHNHTEDGILSVLQNHLANKTGILADVMLSEEGGRFYHEENRNIILNIADQELQNLTEEYLWVTYATLNELIKYNNILNIQLRNLMSLLPLNFTESCA